MLLVSSNGAGMGHLTRLLAYARRLPAQTRAHVLSLSQAAPAVSRLGLTWEYLPSQGASGMRPASWRKVWAERVTEILGRVDPDVLVFDGTHPYAGLDQALASHPRTRSVWSRRGLWKPGRNGDQLAKSAWFDLVLEPGDLASAIDRGASSTATGHQAGHRVRPVTLLDREELSDRATARTALGLPPDEPLALISLGAGNINSTEDEVGAAAAALRAHGIGVCVTAPAIAHRAYAGSGVHLVRHFPLSQHLHAFDYCIAASGYNSFHESLRFGLPTILVPNTATALDDQWGRAARAAEAGWALTTDSLVRSPGRGSDLVGQLVQRGADLARTAQDADPGNGAKDAADAIAAVAHLEVA